MTFDQYREFTGRTSVYLGAGTGHPCAVLYAIMGLADEAGETLGKAKKAIRGDNSPAEDGEVSRRVLRGLEGLRGSEALKAEVGDVLFYFTRILIENGWTLEEIMEANVKKLTGRLEAGTIKGSGDNR